MFTALVVLVAAVLVAVLARDDPGYLVINYRDWVVETSVVLAAAIIIFLFTALYLVLRLFINTRLMPQRLTRWKNQRRINNANAALTNGLLELANGDWRKAEKLLMRHVGNSQTPLLNYLAAARAAQKQDDDERRDHYLQLAHKAMPKAELAIGLTQAELQLNQGQVEQALATLTHLRQQAPRHATVLKLLLRLYVELHDWERLLEILPVMSKRKIIERDKATKLEAMAHSALLTHAASDSQVNVLHDTWQRVSKNMQHHAIVVLAYAQGLIDHGQGKEAEALLNQALTRSWDDRYVRLYGLLQGTDVGRQIRYAEGWLTSHRQNAVLLLTLGRLCVRNKLWAQGRQYLEASLALDRRSDTCIELAQLMDQQGESEQALNFYRQAVPLANSVAALPVLDSVQEIDLTTD
jgi:HemY protein